MGSATFDLSRMGSATFELSRMGAHINENPNSNSGILSTQLKLTRTKFPISTVAFPGLHFSPASEISSPKECIGRVNAVRDDQNVSTPILDTVDSPSHLKNLSSKERKQLADDIRTELSFIMSQTQKPLRASLTVVELTVAIHFVFESPLDKILWDVEEHTYPHKLLTGRRSILRQTTDVSDCNYDTDSIYDLVGAGHGCSSISAGLGLAVARDIKGKRDRIVAVISNETTMTGQVYEAMSNAGYLDSNMIVILNDSRNSLHPKLEEAHKNPINALSTSLRKIISSKFFRKFRQFAKALTKRFGRSMYELAAKLDEYGRGFLGPLGSTLFDELGLYYIGPVDGHNIEDLICVLTEVASLDSMGPVLIHVMTNEDQIEEHIQTRQVPNSYPGVQSRTLSECFVEALVSESKRDKDIVAVYAGMGMEPSLELFQCSFPDKFFNVGMAEQHAVTFSAGLARGGLKPFCIIPSTFLQRAYDQVVHDVDRQKIPVRFVISRAGLGGFDGPTKCGAFDITFMSCLPNMVVMAPSDEIELAHMVATAAQINDRPVCFRYPRGAVAMIKDAMSCGVPVEIGKGRLLVEGRDIAFLAYGSMVQNCLRAQSLLSELGVEVTVADARFCKPLDVNLIRDLCRNHTFLVTVEEGSIGGFGSHVVQFISLDGQLDAGIKWRPLTLPDTYFENASVTAQLAQAGLSGNHIAATALSLLGRNREALLLMC